MNVMVLKEIMINPSTKEPLEIDWEKDNTAKHETSGFEISIQQGIPIVLPKKKSEQLGQSEFHLQQNSMFDYIDHYQKDSEYFNYGEEYENPITRNEIKRLQEKIVSRIPGNAKIILDVGCGNGWLSSNYQKDNNHIISMDISLKNVMESLKNQSHPNHEGMVADVYHLPIKENSIDCIVASEVMEHTIDPKKFIAELIRILKVGGRLIITTPYDEKIPNYLCVHCNKLTPMNAHLHSFNEENIGQLIPDDISNWSFEKFNNKYLIKLRIYLLIKIGILGCGIKLIK